MEKYRLYAPVIVRIGMSLVFLWFGFNQLVDSQSWLGWLPDWAYALPLGPLTLIFLNGLFEVILGGLLLAGLFTRIVAILLSLHLIGIAIAVGYNDVAIRDAGLSLATFSVFLQGPDMLCLDTKWRKREEE